MEFHFLYRDTTLPEAFIATYAPGMDILERGFTDTSKLRGGPNGNIRYLVLSNRGRDLTSVDENARKWGLVVIEHGTIFRVVDLYKKANLTQVLLTTEAAAPDEVIQAARNDLDDLYTKPALPALTSEEWTNRVAAPLGLDDSGKPFPLS